MLAVVRFVDEMSLILQNNGLVTLKQFQNAVIEDIVWNEGTTGGKKVFMRMALSKAKPSELQRHVVSRFDASAHEFVTGAPAVVEAAPVRETPRSIFGQANPKKLQPVNLAARIEELGLDVWFGSELWPEAAPCRELLTKVRSFAGEGFTNPYVYADLKKCACEQCNINNTVLMMFVVHGRFLPVACTEFCPVLLDDDGCVREGGTKKDNRKLDFSMWQLAFDRLALCNTSCLGFARSVVWQHIHVAGSAVIKQMNYKTSMRHKAVVIEVACNAKSSDRAPILGVLFDEVSRCVCQ